MRRTLIPSLGLALALGSLAIGSTSCASKGDPGEGSVFQLYGNWCGPGSPPAGTNPAPIDDVDRACHEHDRCYAYEGYLARSCDEQLIQRLQAVRTITPGAEAARIAIITYFQNSPKID